MLSCFPDPVETAQTPKMKVLIVTMWLVVHIGCDGPPESRLLYH